MKKLWILVSLIAVSLATNSLAQQPLGPLQMKVSKNDHPNYTVRRTESWVDGSEGTTDRETSDTVSYTVDVINMSGQTLTNVEFQWAALINHPGIRLRAEKGKKSHDFKPAEKFSFEAGPIELRTHAAKVEGYYVEALVDGKVIASDIEPSDIKDRIDALTPTKLRRK